MVVGMEVAYVPYEFFKDGEVMGYDVDLTRNSPRSSASR